MKEIKKKTDRQTERRKKERNRKERKEEKKKTRKKKKGRKKEWGRKKRMGMNTTNIVGPYTGWPQKNGTVDFLGLCSDQVILFHLAG